MTATLAKLGFGGAGIGGLFEAVSEEDARGALEAAWTCGIRTFDTAPLYGSGLSERRIGTFLQGRSRESFVVSTKVGRMLLPSIRDGSQAQGSLGSFAGALPYDAVFDFSADGIRRSLESSLDRLGLSHVDVAYLHDPDEHLDRAIAHSYPALQSLRAQGLAKTIGVGTTRVAAAERIVRECEVDVVMIAGRYSLLDQSAGETLLPLCTVRGVHVTVAGAFNSGILAHARPAPGQTYEYARASDAIVERARRIADVCAKHGVRLRTAAMAFPLRHPTVRDIVVGMRSAQEVRDDAADFVREIPAGLWRELDVEGLIRS